ncbi:MAG: diaminopimelate decarboxylase [Clostridia bacterium]|nr:diaminopimelate decarboxylase [Clostridia bacterium]
MIYDNISINNEGALTFANQDVIGLAKKYGTPLYLLDENKIRENCRKYVDAMKANFGDNYAVLYASKANSFKKIYNIVESEGMCADVVSVGEIYTALKAGFSLSKAYFHSNNKTDFDVEFAIENGVGHFVVDNREELEVINKFAAQKGIKQKILLRLTPGIDTHTYEAVNTGKVDSKFGTAIETGQAEEIVKYTLGFENIDLCGFHCHIGSMVFDSDTFIRGAEIMIEFMSLMKQKFGFITRELNLGGGYGVRYVESDPTIDIGANISQVANFIKDLCAKYELNVPMILMEPGRSIVADAGMTLYTVGTVKRITGYKNYVSVDGGMSDNPRYALYESEYTLFNASKINNAATLKCDVVGRCCESGDIIQPNVLLPETERGDILAVCTTGAYNFSMAMNYNRIARPPVVILKDGDSYVAVRRETLEDIIRNDI